MISFIGVTVPSTLETWVTATSLVRSLSSVLKAAMSNDPSGCTGTAFSTSPFSSRSICHGTMLEWCSM